MLFGLGKKKSEDKDQNPESRIRKSARQAQDKSEVRGDSENEGRKRKKKEPETGSRWASVMVLIVSVLLGVGFWVYGILSSDNRPVQTKTRGGDSGGKIIFEKENPDITDENKFNGLQAKDDSSGSQHSNQLDEDKPVKRGDVSREMEY